MSRFMHQSHLLDGAAGSRTNVPGSAMKAISKGVTIITKRMAIIIMASQVTR